MSENILLNTLHALLDDSQAINVVTIDVSRQTSITDYMIVVSGRSSRHVKAIANNLIEQMKKHHCPAHSAHGLDRGDWVLVDFGDYIVHVMVADSRAFYNLEGLWQEN